MANHRADGRASMRKPGLAGGNHRGAALPAQAVKVGVVGALATATIAAPLAAAAAGVDGDVQAGAAPVNLSSVPAQAAASVTTAAAAPVALPVASVSAVETRSDDDSSRSEERGSSDTEAAETVETVETEGIEIEAPDPKVYDENGNVLDESASGYIYPVKASISSGYGWRNHPVLGYAKLHAGVDFAASCGAEVHAAAAGTVVAVEYNSSSGNRVKIDHGNGVITGYYHLSGFNTQVGATVEQGDVVGYVGSTGTSTGCHLHFAKMDSSGEYSNPMTLLQ